ETDPQGWKLVVDYKTSHDSGKNFDNWIKRNQLQLGFYAWVVDRGFVEGLSPGQVGGAVTFSYKRFEKRRGLVLPEIEGRLVPKTDPKEASLEAKENFYAELEALLKTVLKEAAGGTVRPEPFGGDHEICVS